MVIASDAMRGCALLASPSFGQTRQGARGKVEIKGDLRVALPDGQRLQPLIPNDEKRFAQGYCPRASSRMVEKR
jgi:hypothetical protein